VHVRLQFRRPCSATHTVTRLTHICDATHVYTVPWLTHTVWHDSLIYVTWLTQRFRIQRFCTWECGFGEPMTQRTHICDMTHSHVCHHPPTYSTWRTHKPGHTTHWSMCHDPHIYVTRFTHICDTTHSYMWHDSHIYVTRLRHICDTTHTYTWHASLIYVTQLTHICDTTFSYYETVFTTLRSRTHKQKEQTRQSRKEYLGQKKSPRPQKKNARLIES